MTATLTTEQAELLVEAEEAQENAYAPYSEFKVGAAIKTTWGNIYTGANIENINHTNTAHAEQVALHRAVFEGEDTFDAIAISCSGETVPPCGLCRQSLSEFCSEDMEIILDDERVYTLSELLPEPMQTL